MGCGKGDTHGVLSVRPHMSCISEMLQHCLWGHIVRIWAGVLYELFGRERQIPPLGAGKARMMVISWVPLTQLFASRDHQLEVVSEDRLA